MEDTGIRDIVERLSEDLIEFGEARSTSYKVLQAMMLATWKMSKDFSQEDYRNFVAETYATFGKSKKKHESS